MALAFRPGLVPTLATAIAVALLCSLGAWQVRRYQWKQSRIAEWSARLEAPPLPVESVVREPLAHEWRRVTARGHYDHPHSVLLLHVPRDLRDGARVLTPLRLAAGSEQAPALLVDRGWIPSEQVERFLDADRTEGEVAVTGVVRAAEFGEPPPEPPAQRRVAWHRLQPRALQAQIPYRLAGMILVREEEGSAELPVGGFEPPRSRVDHRSYATTWFAMAAIAVATWIGLGIKQAREAASAVRPPAPLP